MSTRYMSNRYDVGSAAAIQQTATMNSQILYGLYDIFNVLFAVTGIEFKAEGHIFGIGAKIFTIAGPVILYGIFLSWIVGIIYLILKGIGIGIV